MPKPARSIQIILAIVICALVWIGYIWGRTQGSFHPEETKLQDIVTPRVIPVHFNDLPIPASRYFAANVRNHNPDVPFGDEYPFDASPLYTYTVLAGYPPVFMALGTDKPKNSAVWIRYNMQEDAFRAILTYEAHTSSIPCQIIDVGANYGSFALPAAAMGCQVLAVEAADNIAAMLRLSVRMNALDSRMTVVQKAVLGESGLKVGVEGNEVLDGGMSHVVHTHESVTSTTITDLYEMEMIDSKTPLLVVQIDTEGCDVEAMNGAMQLLEKRMILNMLVKSGPPDWWQRCSGAKKSIDPIPLYKRIIKLGYEIRLLSPLSLGDGQVVARKKINLSESQLTGSDGELPDPLLQGYIPDYVVLNDLDEYMSKSRANPMDFHGKSAGGSQTRLWFKLVGL